MLKTNGVKLDGDGLEAGDFDEASPSSAVSLVVRVGSLGEVNEGRQRKDECP